MTDNKAELKNLPKGTKIFNNPDTERIMRGEEPLAKNMPGVNPLANRGGGGSYNPPNFYTGGVVGGRESLSTSTNAMLKNIVVNVHPEAKHYYRLSDSGSGDDYRPQVDQFYKLNKAATSAANAIDLVEAKLKVTKDEKERLAYEKELIALYEIKQKNLHNIANSYRSERRGLYDQLSAQGFKFDGGIMDDNANITNAKHLESFKGDKAKQVEEMFDRWNELRYEDIPGVQKEWFSLQDSKISLIAEIDERRLEKEKKKLEKHIEDMIKGSVTIIEKNLEKIDFEMNMLDDDNIDGQMKVLNRRLGAEQGLKKAIEDSVKEIDNQIRKNKDNADMVEYLRDKKEDLERQLRNTTLAIRDTTKAAEEAKKALEDMAAAAASDAFSQFHNRNDMAENLFNFEMAFIDPDDLDAKTALVEAEVARRLGEIEELRERINNIRLENPHISDEDFDALYETEIKNLRKMVLDVKNLEDSLYDKSRNQARDKLNVVKDVERKIMDVIKKRIEEERKGLDENLDAYRKYMQEKIDIINQDFDDDDYEAQLRKDQEEAMEIQREINELMLDDSIEARNKERDLKKKLADKEEQIEDRRRRRQKDQRIKDIQDLIKAEEDKTKEAKKELDKQLSHENLYAEARKALIEGYMLDVNGAYVTLEQALWDYEKQFGEGMSVMGDAIHKELIDNLNTVRDIMKDIDSWMDKAEMRPSNPQNPQRPSNSVDNTSDDTNPVTSEQTKEQMEADKKRIGELQRQYEWYVSTTDPEIVRRDREPGGYLDKLHQEAEAIRKKYNWDYEDLRGYGTPHNETFDKERLGKYQAQYWKFVNSNDEHTRKEAAKPGGELWKIAQEAKAIRDRNNWVDDGTMHSQEAAIERIKAYSKEYMDFVRSNDESIVKREQQPGGFLDRLHQQANKLREQFGLVGSYSKGGIIDKTGIAMVHGSKSAPEVVFNAHDASKLWDFVKNMPKIPEMRIPQISRGVATEGVKFEFENFMHVEGNVDENTIPSLREIADYTINRLNREFNKSGIFKRV